MDMTQVAQINMEQKMRRLSLHPSDPHARRLSPGLESLEDHGLPSKWYFCTIDAIGKGVMCHPRTICTLAAPAPHSVPRPSPKYSGQDPYTKVIAKQLWQHHTNAPFFRTIFPHNGLIFLTHEYFMSAKCEHPLRPGNHPKYTLSTLLLDARF